MIIATIVLNCYITFAHLIMIFHVKMRTICDKVYFRPTHEGNVDGAKSVEATHLCWFNPFHSKISLVILITAFHMIFRMLVLRIWYYIN